MSENKERLMVRILGRVQGIFFRAFAQEKAQTLGLVGWIKNEPSGSVLVIAEGKKEDLENFLKLLKKGPDSAEVSEVTTKWEKPTGEFDRFEIRY